jgi:aminopeptidase Y
VQQTTTILPALSAAQVNTNLRAVPFRRLADDTVVQGTLAPLTTYTPRSELDDYYTLSNQSFKAVVGNVFESRLVLGDTEPESTYPMSLTPPTKHKEAVFGPLVLVANRGCDPSDYPSDTKGGIAFIERGVCSFGDKSAAAGKAGAIAAVVYNNENGFLSGTLGEPSEVSRCYLRAVEQDAEPFIKELKPGR